VHLVYSTAEQPVVNNMLRKEKLSAEMFEGIIQHMTEFYKGNGKVEKKLIDMELPEWLV
jgi:hypothetical protein